MRGHVTASAPTIPVETALYRQDLGHTTLRLGAWGGVAMSRAPRGAPRRVAARATERVARLLWCQHGASRRREQGTASDERRATKPKGPDVEPAQDTSMRGSPYCLARALRGCLPQVPPCSSMTSIRERAYTNVQPVTQARHPVALWIARSGDVAHQGLFLRWAEARGLRAWHIS